VGGVLLGGSFDAGAEGWVVAAPRVATQRGAAGAAGPRAAKRGGRVRPDRRIASTIAREAERAARAAHVQQRRTEARRMLRSPARQLQRAVQSLDTNEGSYVVAFGRRTWRVRGLSAFGVDRLRVNVRVDQDERFHVDSFDLYSARSRRHFLDEVATALQLGDADARELQTEVARVIERLESERSES
jgi:hypothetical protein